MRIKEARPKRDRPQTLKGRASRPAVQDDGLAISRSTRRSPTRPATQQARAAVSHSPVIAIDGPSGSGKGTIAKEVAVQLGFRYLDSGALYRAVALAAQRRRISLDVEDALVELAAALELQFEGERIVLDGEDVGRAIRDEKISAAASKVAVLPHVRRALLQRQRAFRQAPGLVAEGRDMGSVVFPDAVLKIFLTASAEERAQRRYKQLREKGMRANLGNLLRDIAERDQRDSTRSTAPLAQSPDAIVIDTTGRSIAEVVARIMELYAAR